MNRGFLRLPMLPLYGTGAVMMLWVSRPFQNNLLLVYISGLVAATVLEYVTGWSMEMIFKMKYWDYSDQRFNLNGYVCLSSSIAWGFLTIFLTEVVHRPISRVILALHPLPALIAVGWITVMFTLDAVQSVRAALDLAKVLDAMTKMRTELDDIQVQMALLKSETGQRVSEYKDEAALRFELLKAEASAKAGTLSESTVSRMEGTAARLGELMEDTAERVGTLMEETAQKVSDTAEKLSTFTEDAAAKVSNAIAQRADAGRAEDGRAEQAEDGRAGRAEDGRAEQARGERLAALAERRTALAEKRRSLSSHIGYYHRSLLKGNPSASSGRFGDALKELRESVARKREREEG